VSLPRSRDEASTASATGPLVLRGGTVVDGTGREGVPADVLVRDGAIEAIGRIGRIDAEDLDATGLLVAPGFIDIHSHSDYTLVVDPRAMSSIHQGVTLEVVGNCGFGCFPIRDPAVARRSIYGYTDVPGIAWRTPEDYFTRLQAAAPAVNVLSLVPNAQLRMSVMGRPSQPATVDEIRGMRRALEEALDAGAWGYSTGLEYAVEQQATEEEVVELCRAVAHVEGLYATHVRKRDAEGEEGVAEALRTAERAGVRLQISHLLPRAGYELGVRCLERVEAARDRGLDVAFDQHTRQHSFTYLHMALPQWALEAGPDELRRHLTDPSSRARMREYRGLLGSDWSRVVLLDNPVWPQHANQDLATIGERRNQDSLDAIYDLLLEGIDQLHRLYVIIPCHSERQQRETFEHALCMPASDATALALDGPLAGEVFHGAFTWAAWYYRFMVRDHALLTPAEAVFRLTGMPARRLGLTDRGVLSVGGRGDIAVFDPDRFGERGTVEQPNQLAVGMTHVLVNGVLTLREGSPTGERAGQVLRR
jgi:N-acyl-D-amino-acid deacylase